MTSRQQNKPAMPVQANLCYAVKCLLLVLGVASEVAGFILGRQQAGVSGTDPGYLSGLHPPRFVRDGLWLLTRRRGAGGLCRASGKGRRVQGGGRLSSGI